MKRDDIIEALLHCIFAALLAFVIAGTVWLLIKGSPKSVEPHPTYTDTTKASILFEDTWGKALPVTEEDF